MNTLIPIFAIPSLGFIILTIWPKTKDYTIHKVIALVVSLLTFIESLRLWVNFDYLTTDFQYIFQINWSGGNGLPYISTENVIGSNSYFLFGIDGISLLFIVLTSFLIPICILASWDSIKQFNREYLLCFIGLLIILIGVFSVLDILGFYILFEAVLIPMFLVIGVWGARKEKITASYYFFFYTLVGSLLMLLSIFYIYSIAGTTDYLTLLNIKFDESVQYPIFLCFFASLAVKIPKFPFHIWLPQAHVEAPVAGSVLLAGILIKLGSYGFIRFTLPLFPQACEYFSPLIFTLAVIAIIYASLTTIRQTDLKRIIAYSSVGHMGTIMLSIFSLSLIGIEGSIFLQIAHGLVSAALFIIVTLIYERHHTRIVKYYRGLTLTMPIYSMIFLFFTLANIAVPLSCNFVGEFLSLLAVFQVNPLIGLLACSGIVLSAAYALFLYNRVCFGEMSMYLKHSQYSRDITRREFYILLPLIIFTLFFGIFPQILLDTLHTSVLAILLS
jgi:proton-translocating NADH-quinone oxidoreductase chain M